MSDLTDQPRALRDEDSFDVDAMHAWLSERVPGLTGPPQVRQYAGGASNLTYLLRYPERDLILRRPPAGHKAASAHDMGREVTVQQHLAPVYRYVPEIVAFCQDPAVIGCDFYVMERLEGIILRQDLPEGMTLSAQQARLLTTRAVESLIELHQVDPVAAGLDTLGRGSGYVQRQVSGWSRRFRESHTDNVGDFAAVMSWLEEHRPDDVAQRLIHGDFRLDNLVLDGPETLNVTGVLDWEMATVGDPLMDLGCALAYWVQADDDAVMQSARRQPTNLPGMLTRAEIVDLYCGRTGFTTGNWAFYEVFGLFRLAVIAQQIYYRYHHGQTTNPAFKDFWSLVNYLEWRCKDVAGL
ncbi:phosphotransferase family protein [Speluncibacter jeojiensis]|uniref:Phosphotransferase family protein n=1 Tax=Speluncibacter jeojiensis TaxID=2710754 RepID=A0A9X4RCJ1_9ACTN|nr:phosphotransferase family protein [Corynebacteriales bacterium D3-21]